MNHARSGKSGRFVNPILYFLHEDSYSEYNIIITSKQVNLGYGEKIQVACLVTISGTKDMLEVSKSELCRNFYINGASKQTRNNENYFLLHLLHQQLDALNSVSVSAFANVEVFL